MAQLGGALGGLLGGGAGGGGALAGLAGGGGGAGAGGGGGLGAITKAGDILQGKNDGPPAPQSQMPNIPQAAPAITPGAQAVPGGAGDGMGPPEPGKPMGLMGQVGQALTSFGGAFNGSQQPMVGASSKEEKTAGQKMAMDLNRLGLGLAGNELGGQMTQFGQGIGQYFGMSDRSNKEDIKEGDAAVRSFLRSIRR